MLLAVGTPGARSEIREALQALGFREIEDYRAVA
jgi:ribosomal protein L30/L7E